MHVLFFHQRKPDVLNQVFNAWQAQGPACVPFWMFVECARERVGLAVRAVADKLAECKSNAVVAAYAPARRGVLIKLTHVRTVHGQAT